MSWKQERYFSGRPTYDPNEPLPGEIPPERRKLFVRLAQAVVLLSLGAIVGLWLAPETPASAQATIDALSAELAQSRARVQELEKTLTYRATTQAPADEHRLAPKDRARHQREAAKYARALRRVKAQSAAELVLWFVGRWNELLDSPRPNDRTTRRAATLSLLIGGMADNLHPKDYVPWQAEFLSGNWLGELHFDLDGDGLPGLRSAKNALDSFTDVSVCHIAMALNQAMRDAQVLVMPEMRCDRPEARMSVFLQGATFNDALDAFVKAARDEGFVVVDRVKQGMRLVLINTPPPRQRPY